MKKPPKSKENPELDDFSSQIKSLSEVSRRMNKEGKDIRAIIEKEGLEAVMSQARQPTRNKNRFPPEIEKAILEFALQFPTYGQRKVAQELNSSRGWSISEGGVRKVWVRNQLQLASQRVKRLKQLEAEGVSLTEAQKRALYPKKRGRRSQIKDFTSNHPGELLALEVFPMGELGELGKVYAQIAMDVFSGLAFAKLYSTKNSITSGSFVNNVVLPFFIDNRVSLLKIITNQGLSYCGTETTHPFQLFLYLKGIKHVTEKDTAPQLLRFRDVLKGEFFDIISVSESMTLEEANAELQDFIRYYNEARTVIGHKKPIEIFKDKIQIKRKRGTSTNVE